MAELSQRQLEELDQGKPSAPIATFYEKATMDVDKSKAAGRRVYEKVVFVLLKQPGVTDSISYKATPQDVRDYPDAYKDYADARQGVRKTIPINIIPNLQLEHLQELMDMGITTIDQIVSADILPAHLEYARKPAQQFQAVVEESTHASEEESTSEESPENVHEAHRREHPSDVGGPRIQTSTGIRRRSEVAEGNGQGGQVQHHDEAQASAEEQIEAEIERRVAERLTMPLREIEPEPKPRAKIGNSWKYNMQWSE